MARFKQNFTCPFTPEQVFNFFNDYVQKEGFAQHNEGGEQCWKKGVGMATYPQFLKLTQNGSGYVLEAWLKYPILPGVYVGELGITGFFAALPKNLLKDRVNAILSSLKADNYQPVK